MGRRIAPCEGLCAGRRWAAIRALAAIASRACSTMTRARALDSALASSASDCAGAYRPRRDGVATSAGDEGERLSRAEDTARDKLDGDEANAGEARLAGEVMIEPLDRDETRLACDGWEERMGAWCGARASSYYGVAVWQTKVRTAFSERAEQTETVFVWKDEVLRGDGTGRTTHYKLGILEREGLEFLARCVAQHAVRWFPRCCL